MIPLSHLLSLLNRRTAYGISLHHFHAHVYSMAIHATTNYKRCALKQAEM